jgi:hypothetical protein
LSKTDLVGKYFHSLFLAGDKREFYFIIQGKTYPIPHDEMDGQYGLRKSFESQKLKFKSGINPDRKIPSFSSRLKAMIKWLMVMPDRALWKTRTGKAGHQVYSNVVIEKEDLDKIKSNIQSSLTTHLIYSLNQASMPYYEKSKNAWWLLPVALSDSSRTSGNHISFLDLFITPDMKEEEIGAMLKEKLKSGDYWGHLMAFKLLHFVSPKLLSKFLPHFFSKFQRTMTFSHLGQWEVPDLEMKDFEMIAPAFSLSPVFLVCIELNGNLGLYLSKQDHLDVPLDDIMKSFKSILLSGSSH